MLKKLSITAVLLASLAATPMVQAQPPHEGGGPEAMFEHLDLSDAQWLQVHKLLKAHRQDSRPLHQRERALHEQLATLDSSAADYAQRLQKLQDDAAQLARDRVQSFASLKTQIDAVLTPAQRSELVKRAQQHGHRGPHPGD